jgi:hypothetical protein
LLASQELKLSTIFASIPTLIPTHTIRIITHTTMATIIPTTAVGFSAALGVDTMIVMIVAGSVAASAGAATSVVVAVSAEDMASVVVAEDMASAVVVAEDTAVEATGKKQRWL